MERYSGFLLILHLIKVSKEYTQSCNASLETVEQVANCPTSNASYEEAARRKNCSFLPLDKTGCQSFQYHCVLSEDLNAILEVCAPSINIIDYVCAKFSSKFKSIMRVDDQSCGNSTAGCPYFYNSNLAFLYQQCYTKVYNIPTTDITSSTSKELSRNGLENSENKSWIAAVVIVPILLALIALAGIIYWKRKERKKAQKNSLQNRDQVDPLLPVNNIEGNNDGKLQEKQILNEFDSTPNKYPAYKHVETREKSFGDCKISSIKDRAWYFARDGFYYEGYDDVTTCFHCGTQKGDWKEEADIHAEHLTLNQNCEFVKYVQLHILKAK